MLRTPLSPLTRHAQAVARVLAVAVILLGVLGYTGWALGWPQIGSLVHGSERMLPETAVLFCVAGLGVALLSLSSSAVGLRRVGQVLLGVVAAIGSIQLVEHLTGWNLGTKGVFVREPAAGLHATHSDGTPPISSLNFVLLGAGVLLGSKAGSRISFVGQAFLVVALLLVVHVLFGHAYGLESFYGPFATSPMAFETAVVFGLLAFSCLYSGPDRGIGAVFTDPGPSGTLLRRMLPALLLTPLVLGWLASTGRQSDTFGPGFATALVSTGNAVILVGFLGWLVIHMRQSERELRAAVDDLAANEKTFRATFENAFVGMGHLDASRKWTLVNPRLADLLGYEPAVLLEKPLRALVHADHIALLEERLQALQDGKTELFTAQQRWISREGGIRWFDVHATARRKADGEFKHFILVIQDVTAIKRATAEAEDLLRTALEERSRAVEAARARDVLLAIVSHELRSPLNSIRLWASLLQSDGSPDPATFQKALQQIESGVDAQNRLINDLLDVSRFVSGKLELERERVDLCQLAREVAAAIRPAVEEKGLTLEVQCPEGASLVDGDRGRLTQVVRNLIENAIKFTPRGGKVQIRAEIAESEIELRVSDDGAGITAEHLPRIFDQFWQGEGETGRRHRGLGLGLSIVKLVVERHGGRVLALSDGPDRGSTFSVRLPLLARAPATAPPSEVPASLPATGEADVLVVDDERDTAEALALALRIRGLRVRVAEDVESALAAIASQRPQVLVSDLIMPGQTGFDLMRRMRDDEQESRLSRIPAIAISGRGKPSDRWRVRRAGFDAYLQKPVSVDAVYRWIAEALSHPPSTEPARLNVMVLGGAEELLTYLHVEGHQAWRVNDLAEASRSGAELRPGVLLVDLDEVRGDVEDLVRRLRENRLSLFVVGLTVEPGTPRNSEIFDFVLEKPLRPEKLKRTLEQAQLV